MRYVVHHAVCSVNSPGIVEYETKNVCGDDHSWCHEDNDNMLTTFHYPPGFLWTTGGLRIAHCTYHTYKCSRTFGRIQKHRPVGFVCKYYIAITAQKTIFGIVCIPPPPPPPPPLLLLLLFTSPQEKSRKLSESFKKNRAKFAPHDQRSIT